MMAILLRSAVLATLIVSCGGGTMAWAQDPPATDIWLVAIDSLADASDGLPRLGESTNATDRDGYDNQPFFLPSGNAFLYTSIRAGQADIFRFEIDSGSRRRLTATSESEYSPTPRGDDGDFSVVRVEADQRQRLWEFTLDGSAPRLLLPDVAPVGYHAWGDDGDVVLFVLGEPHTLQRAKEGQGAGRHLSASIGRALARIPGEKAISFVHKGDESKTASEEAPSWWVQRYDLDTDTISPLIATLPEREDIAWAPDGSLWGADGGKLYRWCRQCRGTWQEVADLEATHGLRGITRLAIDPHGRWLALVAERPSTATD